MRKDKAAYKLALRTKEKQSANDFSDSLNDALMCKNMDSFWKTWRSKFCGKQTAQVIDGYCEDKDIADRFASVFQAACVPNSMHRHKELENKFYARYSQYCGNEFDDKPITVDLIQQCICDLKKGKAPGIDELTSEHISLTHPVLAVHLMLLFRMLLSVVSCYSVTYLILGCI